MLAKLTWSTQNRLLYFEMEEHTTGKKERAKPPKPPVFEELKIICICGNSHDGSYYNGKCAYNCKDQVLDEQYPVGECPICQCHCLKATKVTNIPKIKAQRRLESHPQHKASQSTKQEMVAFLDRGNHIFANAKSDKIAEYQQLYNDRKLSITSKSKSSIRRRSVNNHASFSKAKSIVMEPPSRAVQKELRKSMKVHFHLSFTSILIHISIYLLFYCS